MKLLWDFIYEYFPLLEGRLFVDSAPVSDKLWAVNSGLGWLGKNSCLINKEIGSFVFISELIVNIDLEYDEPYRSNFCGSCTKCIDQCPTQAIVQPGVIDSNKCISYQTIENKEDSIPDEFAGKFENRVFGCDICQDVCPWNKHPLTSLIKEFEPSNELLNLDVKAWQSMEKDEFNMIFKNSPLKRAKFKGLKRNIHFLYR
jgi:epoxyqueuosine reductase